MNFSGLSSKRFAVLSLTFALIFSLALPVPFIGDGSFLPENASIVPAVSANSTYYNFSGGSLAFNITPSNTNMISSNDDWTGVSSVEGYFGRNLTATHGIDPQTVLGTEFPGNALPSAGNTQVNANKGNPSAYNAGGVTEFDSGSYLAIGFQGNVQANAYMVFYLNTTGRSSITMSYEVSDIDTGSNNAVSPVALQYRIGETGNFTNLPGGFVADATDGPTISGRISSRSVLLPAACNNQAQVQVRLITTNAAAVDGTSTPDEWIGINNVVISPFAPTAATANVGGQVFSPYGRPLANAMLILSDTSGNTRFARTSVFGYYNFSEVEVGQTYVLEIQSKRFVFPQPTQIISVNEDINSLNFYAEPIVGESAPFYMRR